MELIGICGNDDTNQGSILLNFSTDEATARYKERLSWIDERIKSLRATMLTTVNSPQNCAADDVKSITEKLNFESSDFSYQQGLNYVGACFGDKAYIEAETQALLDYKTSLKPQSFTKGSLDCPTGFLPSSDFYLPKSLGAGIDISDDLKKRIAKTKEKAFGYDEDPIDAGLSATLGIGLPAKYYHVYGSAFVACELVAEGHDPITIMQLSRLAAWYYRVLTLSSESLENEESSNKKDETAGWLDSLEEIIHFGRYSNHCHDLPETLKLDSNGNSYRVYNIEMDAMELIRRWTISGGIGKILGGNLYTNLKIPFAEYTGFDRPADWSKDRFKAAKAKFDSMMIDFQWTIQQHELGAAFAIKNCKPDPVAIAKSACRK